MEKKFPNELRRVLWHMSGWLEHTRQLAAAAKVLGDAALASAAIVDDIKVQVTVTLTRVEDGLQTMRTLWDDLVTLVESGEAALRGVGDSASEDVDRDAVFADVAQRMQSMWTLRRGVLTSVANEHIALKLLLQPYEQILDDQIELDDFI